LISLQKKYSLILTEVFLLRPRVVTAPIVGGTKASHIEDAVASLDLELTDDEVSRLEEHYVPHAVVGY
jgi:aryl-alcohol dehydrogenase-like predicted oxidoreductase